MAGIIIHLVPITKFDWSGQAGSTTVTVVLADYIDLSQWKEGQLIARLHTGTSIGTGASASLGLYGIDPAFDDPTQVFESGLLHAAAISLGPSTASMSMDLLVTPFGLMGRLKLTMTQPATPVAAVMYLSVDLVLKTDG